MNDNNKEAEPDVIRNPLEVPASIKNTFGNCYSITLLQVIMFTPSLMKTILDNAECSKEVCNMLNRINSTENHDLCTFPDNTISTYLKHELTLLSGFHKIDGKILDERSEFSYGCISEEMKTQDISLCAHNFYRLLTFGSHFLCDRTRIKEKLSLKPGRTSDVNNTNFVIDKLDPNSTKFIKQNETRSYFRDNFAFFMQGLLHNSLSFIFKYLFLGPDDVREDEISVILIQSGKEVKILYGPNYRVSTSILSNLIAYYVPINFMYIDIDTDEVDRKFHVLDKTILEYMESLKTRPFNERFPEIEDRLQQYAVEMMEHYNVPKIVGISEASDFYHHNEYYASELSLDVRHSLNTIFEQFYDEAVKGTVKLTGQRLRTIFRDKWQKVISVSAYQRNIPENFWDGEEPRNQELFRGKIDQKVHYMPYAFELSMDFNIRKLIKPLFGKIQPPAKLEVWRQRRIDEITEGAKQFEPSILSDELKNLIENEIKIIIKPLIFMESLSLADNYYYYQQRSIGVDIKKPQFIEYENFTKNAHSIGVIKSFLTKGWFVVSNDDVVPIKSLKIFLGRQYDLYSFNTHITTSFWYEENSYPNDVEEIKDMMKPIYQSDFIKRAHRKKNYLSPISK
ncbi:hypothetical protein SNEBB_011495 [Seison nebaliae]|nr:hypothetical protein SNEBB_011495 [Seison nebaliae]